MIKEIKAKTILIKNKRPEMWFNNIYNINLYKGCTHRCIYCDSRSACYNIENFDNDIEVKINSIEVLEKELASRKIKGMIGTGAMTDPYMPIERKYRLTRKALELIDKYNFPVTIVTKSDLILDDIALLKSINEKTLCRVLFTITTASDKLAKTVEPNVTLPSKRLEAMKQLSKEGIDVGVLIMPVLPFIEDDKLSINNIVQLSKKAGAKFIIASFGVTLRDRQRDYYYKKLDEHFPGLKEKYIRTYKNNYYCNSIVQNHLWYSFKAECEKYGIEYKMKNVKTWIEKNEKNTSEQISLF